MLIVTVACLLQAVRGSDAQELCRGDIDGDAQITESDVIAVLPVLFLRVEDIDSLLALRADANDDGAVNAADIAAIVGQQGAVCGGTPTPSFTPTDTLTPVIGTPTATRTGTPPTATPTRSNTATATVTPTATRTQTLRPTPTPTQVCVVNQAHLGANPGELTVSDCRRAVKGELRHVDIFTLSGGTVGTAVKLTVAPGSGTPQIKPEVVVIDSGGQFGSLDNNPPVEFVVTTAQPYEIWVSSDPTGPTEFGAYTMTISARACPTPAVITVPSVQPGKSLDATDCPDPGRPALNGGTSAADSYTFTLTQVPTSLDIAMRQLVDTDTIDPALTIIGPDGFDVIDVEDDTGGGIAGVDERVRFLAIKRGSYTVIARGGVGLGKYSLTLGARSVADGPVIPLNNIPTDRPLVCTGPGQTGVGCSGTLSGDTNATVWAAPLPIPDISDDVPEPGAPADLYSFTTQTAGDVISIEMDSDDNPHLYLVGPASAGNPLVTQDDDSGPSGGTSNAQLAATLVVPGTYTIIAANNDILSPADDTDPAQTSPYMLFVQKCPVRGRLQPDGAEISDSFDTRECLGFGGVPFRSYTMPGTAGQFVSVAMHSDDVDSFVRIFGPDGSRVENDTDLFDQSILDARASRIFPVTGTYYVEVSTSLDRGAVDVTTDPPPGFVLTATKCPTTAAVPGNVSGSWQSADCELPSGQKFDVYTITTAPDPSARAALITPPIDGCVVDLLTDGPQGPENGCSTDQIEFPIVSGRPHAFIVAANDARTRGPYTVPFTLCPMAVIGYGVTSSGQLTGSNCGNSDWFLLRVPAALARFNEGIGGDVTASFPLRVVLSDAIGTLDVGGLFSEDPDSMIPLGSDLAVLLQVSGTTTAARGTYTVRTDPASIRGQ